MEKWTLQILIIFDSNIVILIAVWFFYNNHEGSAIDHSMNNIIGDNKFLTYENTDYVIKIDYSANWIYQNIFTKYKIDIYQVVEW